MHVMKFISLAAILATVVALAVAQQTPPTIKHVPITNASSNSGNEMFNSYCAVPWERWQGQWPGSLRNEDVAGRSDRSGAEQRRKVSSGARRGCDARTGATTRSHGSKDMPVWGPLFSSLSQGQEAQVQQRISNLVSKIETLQTK